MLKFVSDAELMNTPEMIGVAEDALKAEIHNSIEGLAEEQIDAMEISDHYGFEVFKAIFPSLTYFRVIADDAIEAFLANDILNDGEDPNQSA